MHGRTRHRHRRLRRAPPHAGMEEGEEMTQIYLAHGHHHRPEGKWLQRQLELWGYAVINPFDHDPYARHLTRQWAIAEQEANHPRLIELCRLIYDKDVKHIAEVEAVVVYYPDESTGTAQEIRIARKLGKFVVVLTEYIHPFIYANADHVIPYHDEGIAELRRLLDSRFKTKCKE